MGTKTKIAIGIVAGVLVALVAIAAWGLSMVKDEICDHLKTSQAMRDQLGAITTCEQRVMSSGSVEDLNTFVYFVEGTKAAGRAYVRSVTNDQGEEDVTGVLLVKDGKEILIEGQRPPTR